MRQFTDNLGRTWTLAVTLDTVRQVKDATGANLLSILERQSPLMERLEQDPAFICDLVMVICGAQVAATAATVESLRQAMDGERLEQATQALVDAVLDFFPSRRREPARNMVEKLRQIGEAQLKVAAEQLAALDENAIEKMVRQSLASAATTGTGSAGSLPDSLASPTPDQEPSGS